MPLDTDVVITGLGVVSPLGIGRQLFWERLVAAESGIRSFPDVDLSIRCSFGGVVEDFDGKDYVQPRKALKVMSRELQMGYAAARLALDQAGVDKGTVPSERIGTVFGSEMYYSPPEEVVDTVRAIQGDKFGTDIDLQTLVKLWGQAAKDHLYPLWMLKYLPNMPACHVGIAIDAQGPNNTIVLEDTSSLAAVIEAATVIQRGLADVMIAGAAGTRINPTRLVGYDINAYASRREDVRDSSRPYARDRDGFVSGEGAAALVLESPAHAAKRGARVLARISGWGNRFIGATQGQRGSPLAIAAAITECMRKAQLNPNAISHVDAHAMGDPSIDAVEAEGLNKVLPGTLVTASKSLYGHLGSACGMVELVGAVLSAVHQHVPPTRNCDPQDESCPVNIARTAVSTEGRSVIKLSHTIQGHAVALAITPTHAPK